MAHPLFARRAERALIAANFPCVVDESYAFRAESLRRWLELRGYYLTRYHRGGTWFCDGGELMRREGLGRRLTARTYYAALVEACERVLAEKGKEKP